MVLAGREVKIIRVRSKRNTLACNIIKPCSRRWECYGNRLVNYIEVTNNLNVVTGIEQLNGFHITAKVVMKIGCGENRIFDLPFYHPRVNLVQMQAVRILH